MIGGINMKELVYRYTRSFLYTAFFVIFAILLLPFGSKANSVSERDLFGTDSDYTSILYDSNNGLPTSDANDIVQSSDGFIWIGSYSGLVRYDGTNFHRFDSTTGVTSVYSLYVDSNDRIWIGTNENGVAYYDHGTLFSYGHIEGMTSYSIRTMVEDPDGNIIIGTTEGLCYIDPELEFHTINDPQINSAYITSLVRTTDDRIFGLTKDGAIFEMNDHRVISFYNHEQLGLNPINCIYPDPDDPKYLHMGTIDSDYLRVDISKGLRIERLFSLSPLKDINCILNVNGLYWVCAANGIGYVNSSNECTVMSEIPMNNAVTKMITDHENNLWFTSSRQGVMKLVPDRFTDISKLADLDTTVVNTTCVSKDTLWLGCDGGLILVNTHTYDREYNDLTQLLEGVRIRCIKSDTKGNMWLCTYGNNGLICYTASKKIITYNESNGLDSDRIRDIKECSDGTYAVATGGDGMYMIENGKVTTHLGSNNGLSNPEILTIEEGPDQKLYLGTDGDGIYIYDQGQISRLGLTDGLTSGVIMQIKWDSNNQLFWLITSNSIEYIKDGEITPITTFPYSNNFDVFPDSHGGAWILSSNGIYITKVNELLADNNIQYSFYNTKSGLPYITTSNSRSYLDENGKLYISGTTGVCAVNIDQESGNNDTVLLSIPSVEIDGRTQYLKDDSVVSVPAGCKRVDIDIYAITYGLNNPRISYFLEGFEKTPFTTTKQELDTVTYTNLDGGTYTFHLNVINDETGEIDKSATIKIIKETSVYESKWFWVLLTLIIVSIVAYIIWDHFKKLNAELLRKQEADRKFIGQIMHAFAKCIDLRDTQNRGHSFRVGYYTKLLSQKLAQKRGYDKDQINEFYNIALLHDIGKLSIPDKILNKTERLDDEEYAIMKTHAKNGAEMLEEVSILKDFSAGAGCHHERVDGKGYPNGLEGKDIPEVAKIIAVADCFDAMYSTRPYRKILDIEVVMNEIKRIRGTQLDEEVCDALFELYEDGELDRTKVDAAVFATHAEHAGNNDSESETNGSSKENDAFQKSLGL